MASVGSVEEPLRATEAGGPVRGEVATMALVPAVVDAVEPLPVVAAGSNSDGRGFAGALCRGAEAAWTGTRFLAARAADIHPVYRDRVPAAVASDTSHSRLFDGGWPGATGRVLRNSTVEDRGAAGPPAHGERPGEGQVIARDADGGAVLRYDAVATRSKMQGETEAARSGRGRASVS
nr:nitronate monooxygenase [Defluviimonas salinarum]